MTVQASTGEPFSPRMLPRLLTAGGSLDEALADVAAYAAELLACRHALVALLDDAGTAGRLGTYGLTEAEVDAVTSAPAAHGIARTLLTETPLLRVDEITTHPATAGFRAGHPPVSRFLGCRLDGSAGPLGLLLLGDPHDGQPFDSEDEQLLAAFAPAAEAALENAAVLREARLSQRWSAAAADFMRDLLLGTVDEPLPALARTALELAEADGIVILLRVSQQHLQVLHVQGPHGEEFLGATVPYRGSLAQEVIRAGEGRLLPDLGADERAVRTGVDVDALGPALMLPLRGSDRVRGSVLLSRRKGARRFGRTDLHTAQAFADHATVALELAAARDIEHRLERLTAEHRAARDLHDHVVQRLFATGLSFRQALPGVDGKARERIEAGMLSLEETVQEIRDKILSLRHDHLTGG